MSPVSSRPLYGLLLPKGCLRVTFEDLRESRRSGLGVLDFGDVEAEVEQSNSEVPE